MLILWSKRGQNFVLEGKKYCVDIHEADSQNFNLILYLCKTT